MRRRITIVSVLVIAAAILSTGTLAYYTSQGSARNIITSGGVEIELEEWADRVGGTAYPGEPIEVMPGTSVTKIVTVKNTDAPAFVRTRVELVLKDADGKVLHIDNLEEAVHIEIGTDWVEKDGWYYYKKGVALGGRTTPLFSEVAFDGPGMTDEYQNCTVEIVVYAQAVQSDNNGTAAVDAAGWPAWSK